MGRKYKAGNEKSALIIRVEEHIKAKKSYKWVYNTQAWRNVSKRFRLENQTCKICEKWYKRTTIAQIVDHIIPVRERPDLLFNPSNFQALCKVCHREKTRLELRRIKGPLFSEKYGKYQAG